MTAPVNLNKVRKDRNRVARKTQADENAVRFGRTKTQKDAEKASKAQQERRLESHKRET